MTDLILIGTDENGIETYLDPNTNDLFQEDFTEELNGFFSKIKKGFKKIGKFVGNGAKFAINNSGASFLKKKITGKNIVRNSRIKGVFGKLDRKAQGFRNAQAAVTLAVAGGAAAKKGIKSKGFTNLKSKFGKGTFGRQLLDKGGEALKNKLLPGQQATTGYAPEQAYLPQQSFAPQGFNTNFQQGLIRQGNNGLPPAKDNTPLIIGGVVVSTLVIGGLAYAIMK